jgi:hypothetical protein
MWAFTLLLHELRPCSGAVHLPPGRSPWPES